jgi:hypothetical protein
VDGFKHQPTQQEGDSRLNSSGDPQVLVSKMDRLQWLKPQVEKGSANSPDRQVSLAKLAEAVKADELKISARAAADGTAANR